MSVKRFVVVNDKNIRRGDFFGYWELASGDTAYPLIVPRFSDKSVHMFGTWGGSTVALNASNDPALSQFDEAYDPFDNVISQSAARKPWIIFPNVYALKPVMTGGSGSLVRIAIFGKGEV